MVKKEGGGFVIEGDGEQRLGAELSKEKTTLRILMVGKSGAC